MKLLSRFFDNPLVGRQLSTSLTGSRLAGIYLFVNAALMCTAGGVLAFFMEEGADIFNGPGSVSGELRGGRVLHYANCGALFFLLVFLLPLRATGWFEGPRFGRGLDQLLVTGVSPLRLHLGNWGLGLVFSATVLLVSLPFAAIAYVFGGIGIGEMLRSYGTLWLYSNLIIAVTIALAVFEREILTVVVSMLLIGGIGLLSIIPERDMLIFFPAGIGEITPLRIFLRESGLLSSMNLPSWALSAFQGSPRFFFGSIPLSIFPFGLWTLLTTACVLYIIAGPVHQFDAGLNNFGTVVLPGDRKRRVLARLRFILTRRVDMAFLYENRPAWCLRWDGVLRFLADALFVLTLWGAFLGAFQIFSALLGGGPMWNRARNVPGLVNHMTFQVFLWFSAALFALWIVLRVDHRRRARWRHPVGRWKVSRQIFVATQFALYAGVFYICHAIAFDAFFSGFALPAAPGAPREALREEWQRLVLGVCVYLTSMFCIGRLYSAFFTGTLIARAALLVTVFVLTVFSPILLALLRQGQVPEIFRALSGFAPMFLMRLPPEFATTPTAHQTYFYATHAIIIAGSLLLLFLVQRRARRIERDSSRGVAASVATVVGAVALALSIFTTSERTALAQRELAESETKFDNDLGIELVEYSRGFGRALFQGETDFITLVLKNRESEDVSGELWLAFDGEESERAEFEVPQGTTPRSLDGPPRDLRWRRPRSARNDILTELPTVLQIESDGRKARFSIDPPSVSLPQGRRRGGAAFVLVGEKPAQSKTWAEELGNLSKGRPPELVNAKALFLPEYATDYDGVSTVVLRPADLATCTALQQSALYDFVRLGGVIIFSGPLNASRFEAGSAWREIFDEATERRESHDGYEVIFFEWESGTTHSTKFDVEKLRLRLPIVHDYPVGFGTIRYSGIDFVEPALPSEITGQRLFWQGIFASQPHGCFPVAVSVSRFVDRQLESYSAIGAIFALFVTYALVLFAVLFFGFRGKKNAGRRWVAIVVISVIFVALVPPVGIIVDSGTTQASLREISYYRADSSSGVALGHLHVRSSGKQGHVARLDADRLSAYRIGPGLASSRRNWGPWWQPRLHRSPLTHIEGEDAKHDFEFRLAPWSSRQDQFIADLPPLDLSGARASFESKPRLLSLELPRLTKPAIPERVHVVAMNFRGKQPIIVYPCAFDTSDETTLRGVVDMTSEPPRPARGRQFAVPASDGRGGSSTAIWIHEIGSLRVSWNFHRQPRLWIVWRDDLSFERPVDPRYAQGSGRTPWSERTFERDGTVHASSNLRVVVLEIPVEVEQTVKRRR